MRSKVLSAVLACAIGAALLFAMGGCSAKQPAQGSAAEDAREYYTSVSQLEGKRAGILAGSTFDSVVSEVLPTCEQSLFSSEGDLVAALISDKVDFFPIDRQEAVNIVGQTPGITYIDQSLKEQQYGFAFGKDSRRGDAVRLQLNTYLSDHSISGDIPALRRKWFADMEAGVLEERQFTGENGKIAVACDPTLTPYCFIVDGQIIGYEIDILRGFAAEYGYTIEFESFDLSGVVPALASGRADIGCSGLPITDKRSEGVSFSEPFEVVPTVCVVAAPEGGLGFFASLAASFDKTFVQGDNWKMILSGIGTTLLISIMAAILGTVFGFLLYLLSRRSGKVLNKVFDALSVIVGGLPAVVLLMLLYYVLFAGVAVSGTAVSIGAFTLSLGMGVYSGMKNAVDGVDPGQFEAAYSLGFTDSQAFFRVVLPQAMRKFVVDYENALVALVQGTSIVGYIAVQDLTRASDLIRSSTFEAFFPIVFMALVYLVLGWLLVAAVHRLAGLFEPKIRTVQKILAQYGGKRSKVPKGGQPEPVEKPKKPKKGSEIIRVEHVVKSYDDVTVFGDLSVSIKAGDVISIIGPSGSGKSTFLRMMSMLELPTAGSIFVDGEEVTAPRYPLHKLREKMGMVFQYFNLFNHLTVIENVTFAPIRLKGVDPATAYRQGMDLLDKVGLTDFAMRYPDQLSGGQKQRAAIARTIAMDPEVLLFDEPTSALDPTMVEEVEYVIRNLIGEGYTMLTVTHDMELAENMANRVIYLDEGGAYEDGPPEQVFHNPKKEKTRAFIKRLRAFECTIDKAKCDYPGLTTELNQFAFRYNVPADLSLKIKSIFEELCFQILLPKMRDEGTVINFTVNYSSKEKKAVIIVRYRGISVEDPDAADASPVDMAFDDGFDFLAWRIIKGRADKIVFESKKNDVYDGRISIKLGL